jgi:TRAP-type C4-dicarboxylate transport system substrate-binding protein
MARVSTASMIEFVPALKVLSLPYIWRDQVHMWTVLKGDIGQRLLVEMIRSQFYGLCYYEAGARSFYTSKRPIKSVADLEGLRIGVPLDPLIVELVNILKAYAIPMASSEVYDAFRKNVIDGAEQNWLIYESTGHYEVAAYYTLDMHTRVPDVLIGSTAAFERKLTPEQITLLRQAAWETQDVVIQRWNERVESSKRILSASHNRVTKLSPEAFQGFVNAVQPLYRKYGADHAALIEAIRAAQ